MVQIFGGNDCQELVVNLKKYNLQKNIKEQLKIINPLLSKSENDIKVHLLHALENGIISKDESRFLEVKMELGRMCLEIEQALNGVYVTMLFYDCKRNSIYHGACPSIPVDFFDFFGPVNEQGLLNENLASCGRAMFTQEVIQTDIETSPLWSSLKDYVFKYGFKSCTSIPFFTKSGKVAGTYAHYSAEENRLLSQDEVEMIQEKTWMFSEEIQSISDRLGEYTKAGMTGLTI